jgi:polyhydroxybutyrate depolymerase
MAIARPLILLLAALLTPCLAAEPGSVLRTIASGGLSRTYWLHLPAGADPAKPLPLILAFHGFTDNGGNFSSGTGFGAIGDQKGFIVAYPNALPHADLGGLNSWMSANGELADGNAGFVADVMADVAALHPVDAKRIFVTGMSQGGAMCYIVAGLYPNVVAAIAPVVVCFPTSVPASALAGARPLPVLMMNGTLDNLVPYFGGPGIGGTIFRPTPDFAAELAAHDACFPWPLSYDLPNWNWFDGCTVSVKHWFWGAQNSEVILYTINGGGHTWPSSRTWVPSFLFGNVCYDFDAAATIWDFFARHPLPSGVAN